MNLPIYSNNECVLATKKLSSHVNMKETFNFQISKATKGAIITQNLNKKNLRKSYYKECTFDGVSGKSIGFAGSKFDKIIFNNCDFENGNMHSCDFSNVKFSGNGKDRHILQGVGFHKSVFVNCIFQNLSIFSCGFTDAIFYNTTFENCTIKLCSLESAQFKNCNFLCTNMATLNLEYVEFDNIGAESSIFPFITIPVAHGLLKILPSLADNNVIYSASNENHSISIKEYMCLLDDFERYYYKIGNYHALTNIYVFQNRIEESYEALTAGILNAIKIKDFRMLRQYCKLVYSCDIFTIWQRRKLYENIMKWIEIQNLSLSENHYYQLYSGSIREMLLNNDYQKPTLYFYLETNIEPNQPEKQALLLSVMDYLLDSCKIPSTAVELRHNSEYIDFWTVVCSNMSQISQILIMAYGALSGIRLFATSLKEVVSSTQNIISSHDQHKINKLMQKKEKLELENLKDEINYKKKIRDIEYQKSKVELEKMVIELETLERQAIEQHQILSENDIQVSVQHTSRNLNDISFPEMIHYNNHIETG